MARRDEEEFAAFVAANQAALRRTAFLMCRDWDLASDFVQEAFIRVYRRWPRLHRDNRLLSYARRAVVSAVIDAKRLRSASEIPVAGVPEPAQSGPDHSERQADREVLMDCLSRLPARQRACVVLRIYEDLPVAEVAELLACSEGTVKSQTSRGVAVLKREFVTATGRALLVSDGSRT